MSWLISLPSTPTSIVQMMGRSAVYLLCLASMGCTIIDGYIRSMLTQMPTTVEGTKFPPRRWEPWLTNEVEHFIRDFLQASRSQVQGTRCTRLFEDLLQRCCRRYTKSIVVAPSELERWRTATSPPRPHSLHNAPPFSLPTRPSSSPPGCHGLLD